MGGRYIFAIDIGSYSLKGLVVMLNPKRDALELVAKVEAPAAGVKGGVIVDIDDAVQAVGGLVDQVEATMEREMKEAVVTVGGPYLETRFAKGTVVVSRADEEIGKEDVERAMQAAEATMLPQNRMLLHAIPRSYLIDEADRVKDPVGMQGTRLSCEALLIDTFSPSVKQLQKTFSVIGVAPSSIVASVLAGSWATVPKKERDIGVCAIDLGSETTTLTVFEDGELLHAHVIPLGSRHVTADIATALKIHFDAAEKIKLAVGHASPNQVPKKEMIPLSQFIDGEEEAISRKYIADIIEARISEIFELVVSELKKMNRSGKLPGGAIIFGGGARIPGIVELAKRELKLSSRLANLDHYRKIFPEGVAMQFFPACGLILWSLDSMLGQRRERRSPWDMVKGLFKAFLP